MIAIRFKTTILCQRFQTEAHSWKRILHNSKYPHRKKDLKIYFTGTKLAKQKTKQTVPNDDPVVPGMDKLESFANKTEVVLVSRSKDWSNKNSPLEKKERLIRPQTLPPNRSKTTCLNLIKLAGLSCKQNLKRQIFQSTAPTLKTTTDS